MKTISIGHTKIVVAHIAHFEFTHPKETPGTAGEATPGKLSISIDGNYSLNFYGSEAEDGHRQLISVFE